jgi:hypothetical protein
MKKLLALTTALGLALSPLPSSANNVNFSTVPELVGDAYFSQSGTDSGGTTIGVDCTKAAPCKTVTKALAFLATNISGGAGPNRNYTLLFDASNQAFSGAWQITSPVILTSAHTVSAGYTTTFGSYNTAYGTRKALWTGGVDTAGTWSSTTLNSQPACVSTALTGHAGNMTMLSGSDVNYYAGTMWVNGHRVNQVMNPRPGYDWAPILGLAEATATATFTNGSTNITINDLSKLPTGVGVGFTQGSVVFMTATNGFLANTPYRIINKSANTGSGTITVGYRYANENPIVATSAGPGSSALMNLSPIGTQNILNPTATYAAANPSVNISDLSKIGRNGDPIQFQTTVGNVNLNYVYYIQSKSAATGPGTIQLYAGLPGNGGTLVTPSTSGSALVNDPIQSLNAGDRTTLTYKNQFAYNPTYPIDSATNPTDVKVQINAFDSSAIIPVATTSAGVVTLNSRSQRLTNIYPMLTYRVLNRFEDLGTGGFTGELYTDRTGGNLYYTPRADLGETCASLNVAGTAIIPGSVTTMLKISTAQNDIFNSGTGVATLPAGNIIFKNIQFSHVNSTAFTGAMNIDGSAGGITTSQTQFYDSAIAPAIQVIGANNVTFESVQISHMASAGIVMSYGTNHSAIQNSEIYDLSGGGVTTGMLIQQSSPFRANASSFTQQTTNLGPSTPSFTPNLPATYLDLTGAADCCVVVTNNKIHDAGQFGGIDGCVRMTGGQKYAITYNTIYDCGRSGVAIGTWGLFNTPYQDYVRSTIHYAPVWGNDFSHNEVYYTNREQVTYAGGTSSPGTAVPMRAMSDFGAVYLAGPQDGTGTGSVSDRLTYSYNYIHDWTASVGNTISATNRSQSLAIINPQGYNGVGDYHDSQVAAGIIEHHNVFATGGTSTAGGYANPNVITQHTGDQRTTYYNNIFYGTFPTGAGNYGDSIVRNDLSPCSQYACWKNGMSVNYGLMGTVAGNLYQAAGAVTAATVNTAGTFTGTTGDYIVTGTTGNGYAKYAASVHCVNGSGMTAVNSIVSNGAYQLALPTSPDPVTAANLTGAALNITIAPGFGTDSGSAAPSCSSNSCTSTGGSIYYYFLYAAAGSDGLVGTNQYNNITAWSVGGITGATTAGPFNNGLSNNFSSFPLMGTFANNLYSMNGANLSYWSSNIDAFATVVTLTQAGGGLMENGTLYGGGGTHDGAGILPNFNNPNLNDFSFASSYAGPGTATPCGGTGGQSPTCWTGFTPWDYKNVAGAH